MLAQYISRTQRLLNDTQSQFFDIPTLTDYINMARRRIAAVSGCLRFIPPGTLTVPRQEQYPFRNWIPLVQAKRGCESILACRSLSIAIGGRWERGEVAGGGFKTMWRRIPFSDFQARFRIWPQTFFGTISEPG